MFTSERRAGCQNRRSTLERNDGAPIFRRSRYRVSESAPESTSNAEQYLDILDSSQEESATNYHQYETPESEYEQLDDIAAVRRESLPAPPVYDPLRLWLLQDDYITHNLWTCKMLLQK